MNVWERWATHILTAVVSSSGLAYLWMKYGLASPDPFSVINHPWQPVTLHGHILSAPLQVLMFGMLLKSHIAPKLGNGNGSNRRSGWIALVAFGPMVLSGYFLQVASDPAWSRVALTVHLASSGVLMATYAVHSVISLRLLRSHAKERAENAIVA